METHPTSHPRTRRVKVQWGNELAWQGTHSKDYILSNDVWMFAVLVTSILTGRRAFVDGNRFYWQYIFLLFYFTWIGHLFFFFSFILQMLWGLWIPSNDGLVNWVHHKTPKCSSATLQSFVLSRLASLSLPCFSGFSFTKIDKSKGLWVVFASV